MPAPASSRPDDPAPALPAGIRALLLTDVVDSTRLSEHIGDQAMAQVWAAHDRLARDLLPAHRGLEIDKTDGMPRMFDSAADALQYALAYHEGLAGLAGLADLAAGLPLALPWPLRARAGLHVGPVILRRNSADDVARGAKPLEVDGIAKPTAARVMSLAQGGQTLLSADARQALGATLTDPDNADPGRPGALYLQAHGHWLLKGLASLNEPVRVSHKRAVVSSRTRATSRANTETPGKTTLRVRNQATASTNRAVGPSPVVHAAARSHVSSSSRASPNSTSPKTRRISQTCSNLVFGRSPYRFKHNGSRTLSCTAR